MSDFLYGQLTIPSSPSMPRSPHWTDFATEEEYYAARNKHPPVSLQSEKFFLFYRFKKQIRYTSKVSPSRLPTPSPTPPASSLVTPPQPRQNMTRKKAVRLPRLTMAPKVVSPKQAKKRARKIKRRMDKAAFLYLILKERYEAYMMIVDCS